MSFIYVADGIDDVLAAHLNQYADAWSGVAGKGQPFNAVAVNDPINFAISARNLDPTNSRACQFLKADGTVLFQVDASGVKVSPDGTVAGVPVTVNATQTLTNKTIVLQTASNVLAADVVLNNTAAYFDGPSMAQGTVGTWLVIGTVTCLDTTGTSNFFVKLWDGTTVVASGHGTSSAGSTGACITLGGIISAPAANMRMSVRDSTNATGLIKFNSSGNSKDSSIWGVRIG